MSNNPLYLTWFRQIKQLAPYLRKNQLRMFAWLLVGIYEKGSVQLHKIAARMPGEATEQSKQRRLRRFLDNAAIRVRPLYEPLARQLLAVQAANGEICLVIDGTKIGSAHQLLMVAIAVRRRALPIAWTWMRAKKGHSSASKQIALLSYVHSLLPKGVCVVLVGDTEFESGELQQKLDKWQWKYVLRQKPNNQVRAAGQEIWQRFGDVIQRSGQSDWWQDAYLTLRHQHQVNLLAHWARGEKQPWLLATNLPTPLAALKYYRRRMWIEEMFGDMKDNGFDLESTRLKHFLRLSRLTLAVALLYVWCFSTGTHAVKQGVRYLVDRKDRRYLSIFQIGLRYIERLLVNQLPVSIRLKPFFR